MSGIITVGLDLTKNVFQLHGAEAETGSGVFQAVAVMRHGDEGL